MHIDAEEIKEKYGQGRLIFEYFGELTQELVPFLFERIEKNLAGEEHVLNKVRRIAKICLEILQNTLHYQDRHELPPEVRKSLLLIYAKDGQFFYHQWEQHSKSQPTQTSWKTQQGKSPKGL